ncbi:MAG TPA: TonB-dependent receptor [Candidatus Sulfotelmatobacter sp.]|nr:TonB-dependent receptor [Candidatus Sulfotelmatobacter sp.]
MTTNSLAPGLIALACGLIVPFCSVAGYGLASGEIRGITRDVFGKPLPAVQVIVRGDPATSASTVVSGWDGSYMVGNLSPGRYELKARKEGFATVPPSTVLLARGQGVQQDLAIGAPRSATAGAVAETAPHPAPGNFLHRFFRAYADDWKAPSSTDAAAPAFRGTPSPVDGPPFPFSDWPYGGSVVISKPWTQSGPLMQALWSGPHGEGWKRSGIQIYGWANFGFNLSTSNKPGYANLPAAYAEKPNTIQPDQEVLYIERQPDTVQTDHFDWGFRVASLYGLDYRFTTAKGVFSEQLLKDNREYGFDPVMVYADLYFPHVAQGMDVRIGRYISLPDIEAQLAPNNYTYTHSLTYTYDCYTQSGINTTTKLTGHWLFQAGISAGCEAVPWTRPDSKPTFNTCLGYSWQEGGDNLYACANSINDGKYAYNNLAAYYLTWYHKINGSWHTATESWYQYESRTPNVLDPAASSLIQTNANGAVCATATQLTCFAPEWAVVNYVEKQISKHDYFTIRNEYMDDMRGQRTGFKTKYTEHLIGWGHWVGTTVLLRPELRFERSYDVPAYDNGTKKNQLMLAGDVIYFF